MVDFDLEIKNIQPINTKNMEYHQYIISDAIKKSIILYNNSIVEIKTNNLDAAIKDLKKALSYNQGFSEAIKLLGLCYVNKKKFRIAEKTFKKLAEYEIYADLAKKYIKNLTIERTKSKTIDAIRKLSDSSIDKKKQLNPTKYLRKSIIIGFSIFIIVTLGFTITYWLVSNLQIDSKKVEVTNKVVESEKKQDANSDQDKSVAEKNTVSFEDYRNVEKKLDTTKSELDQFKNKYDTLLMLNEAEKSYRDGNYEKAADTLLNIKDMKYDDEIKNRYDKLLSDIKTRALWPIYNQGHKLYMKGKYEEALPKLKIVSELDPDLYLMPWVIYQIGVCYNETNDNTSALVFLQKVKDNYPKSEYASYAEKRINQIGNK
jgi:tetratricopeptide (TPR) repeat protein